MAKNYKRPRKLERRNARAVVSPSTYNPLLCWQCPCEVLLFSGEGCLLHLPLSCGAAHSLNHLGEKQQLRQTMRPARLHSLHSQQQGFYYPQPRPWFQAIVSINHACCGCGIATQPHAQITKFLENLTKYNKLQMTHCATTEDCFIWNFTVENHGVVCFRQCWEVCLLFFRRF